MTIRGRNINNYTQVLFEDTIKLEEGTATYIYAISAFPFTPSFILELQPENQTKTVLESLTTTP